MARAMYPGDTGVRPRIQLWHGSADTIINYANYTEAVEQWTNVLGLSATPTMTSTLSIGGHNYNRRQWKDSCGITVLDAFDEPNGPHGPDANMNGQYSLPFFNLDQTTFTPTDPPGPAARVAPAAPVDVAGRAGPPALAERPAPRDEAARPVRPAPREARGAAERPGAAAASHRPARPAPRAPAATAAARQEPPERPARASCPGSAGTAPASPATTEPAARQAPRVRAGTSTRPAWVETRAAAQPAPPARRLRIPDVRARWPTGRARQTRSRWWESSLWSSVDDGRRSARLARDEAPAAEQ